MTMGWILERERERSIQSPRKRESPRGKGKGIEKILDLWRRGKDVFNRIVRRERRPSPPRRECGLSTKEKRERTITVSFEMGD